MELALDSDAIPFGSVTQGSSSSRKLIMTNSGDIGTPFQWNTEKFKPNFSIVPDKGKYTHIPNSPRFMDKRGRKQLLSHKSALLYRVIQNLCAPTQKDKRVAYKKLVPGPKLGKIGLKWPKSGVFGHFLENYKTAAHLQFWSLQVTYHPAWSSHSTFTSHQRK